MSRVLEQASSHEFYTRIEQLRCGLREVWSSWENEATANENDAEDEPAPEGDSEAEDIGDPANFDDDGVNTFLCVMTRKDAIADVASHLVDLGDIARDGKE